MTTPQDPLVAAERSPQRPPRKTYQKPELQLYGDLAEITQGIAGSKTNDGSGHPNMHFTS
jgi:hypothetical protein